MRKKSLEIDRGAEDRIVVTAKLRVCRFSVSAATRARALPAFLIAVRELIIVASLLFASRNPYTCAFPSSRRFTRRFFPSASNLFVNALRERGLKKFRGCVNPPVVRGREEIPRERCNSPAESGREVPRRGDRSGRNKTGTHDGKTRGRSTGGARALCVALWRTRPAVLFVLQARFSANR